MKKLLTLTLLCAGWLAMSAPLQARQAPPFGDSLTWDTGKEAPALERLRGKSVLIVFFQDWCGICNRWSGDMFRQVGEAYADDPTVALIAIKTDGGSLRDAQDYLKTRTDLRHWMVAVDENATYYRQATGQNKLYKYLSGSHPMAKSVNSTMRGTIMIRMAARLSRWRRKNRERTTARTPPP